MLLVGASAYTYILGLYVMSDGKIYTRKDFIDVFNRIAKHKHRYEVFRDFVIISAISLHNAINKNEEMEQEYLNIVGQYEKEEISGFCELLAILVELLQPEPRDILGGLYMELELGNDNTGQFFTPPEISLMLAQMSYGDQLKEIQQDFVTLSEPACGAGGMVLAFVKVMISHSHDPAKKLWVQCIDVDRLVAMMCYVQLSLWNVPAEVIVGDSLKMEFRQTLYTPAHYLGGWSIKLHYREAKDLLTQPPEEKQAEKKDNDVPALKQKQTNKGENIQFDFGF